MKTKSRQLYNVVIWDGTQEVGINRDGTRTAQIEQAEVFDEQTAREVKRTFGGAIIDASFDDGWDD